MESPTVSKDKISLDEFVEHLGLNLNTKLSVKDGMTVHAFSDGDPDARSTVPQFFTRISSNDHLATQKLASTYSWKHKERLNKYTVSKRDVLFAILSCCDSFMLQLVFSKLYDCGCAIPILLPAARGSDIKFMLWSSRRCSNIVSKAESVGVTKINLCKHPLLTVSALRFGVTKVSKSEILNAVVAQFRGDDNANCFLAYNEHERQSCWSQGSVDMGCIVPRNTQNGSNGIPSLSFLNLRGNALQFTLQKNFCLDVSKVVIIFLPQEITEVYKTEVNRVSELKKLLIIVHHDYQKQTLDFKSENILYINIDGFTPHEIATQLSGHLKTFSQRNSALTETLEVYVRSCSKYKIEVDETDFEEAKTLASSIHSEISQWLSTPQVYEDNDIFEVTRKKSLPLISQKSQESGSNQQLYLPELRHKVRLKRLSGTTLSAPLILFLKSLEFDNVHKIVFLSFLRSLLDMEAFNALETLITQYKNRLYEPLRVKGLSEDMERLSMSNVSIGDDPLYKINFLTNEMTICVGAFLQQLWELLQCSHPDVPLDPSMYGKLLATCIIHGHSTNILHYESNTALSNWTESVMKSLHSLLGENAKVRVVSIFGGFTSNKSTLLNHLFGAQFTDSENLCFRGTWLQLLPVHEMSKTRLGFDYLLLLNVESVWLSEIINHGYSERREYISSVVSSITDVLIICINQNETKEEKSAIFDITVHSILKASKNNVLKKCCVLYQINDRQTTDQYDLEEETFQRIQESCTKTYARCFSSELMGHADKQNLFKKTWKYFTCNSSNHTIMKNIIRVVSPHNNLYDKFSQDYARSLSASRKFVLNVIVNLQTEACSFFNIGKRVKNSVTDSMHDTDSIYPVFFYQVTSTSVEENVYYLFKKKCLKVEEQLIHRLETTFKRDVTVNQGFSLLEQNQIESVTTAFTQVLESALMLTKESGLSSTRYTIVAQKLQAISSECVSRILKQINSGFKNTNKNKLTNIELEAEKEVIWGDIKYIKTTNKSIMDKVKEATACIEAHADRIIKENPLLKLHEVKAKVIRRINDELREKNYGSEVEALNQPMKFAECYVPSKPVMSKEDVVGWRKQFNSEDKVDEEVLTECKKQLDDLSLACEKFEQNALSLVSILESYLKRLKFMPEKLTMFIFIFMKFICNSDREQLKVNIKICKGGADSKHESHAPENDETEATATSSLENKIQYILNIARNSLTSAEYSEFHSTLTAETARNFDHVPFNIRTLQRLDRNFLRILPKMSSKENMSNILEAVNDAKIFCFGKALAKAPYNFDEWFEYVFKTIQSSSINNKSSKQIKATAFVHVCAWASQLVTAKEYQQEKEKNIGEQFKVQVPLLKLGIQLTARELTTEKLCELISNEFEQVLSDSIQDELQSKLLQCLRDENRHLLVKRQFIGNMLRSFCMRNSFKNIISFVTDYDFCSSKWVLDYIAERINDSRESLLKRISTDIITEKVEMARSCVHRTISLCSTNSVNGLHSIINTVKEKVFSEMHYSIFTDYTLFELLEENVQLNDLESCLKMSQAMWLTLRRNLTKNIELPVEGNFDDTKSWILSLPRDMHNNFSRSVVGCTVQCPLCGTVCDHSKSEHDIHSTDCHLPVGFKGVRDKDTASLLKFNCIYLVKEIERVKFEFQSDDDDNNDDTRKWKILCSHWDINKKQQQDPSLFWKYVFKHFQCELSQYYECSKNTTLLEWDFYSREDAIKSLETAYKLEPSKDRLASET